MGNRQRKKFRKKIKYKKNKNDEILGKRELMRDGEDEWEKCEFWEGIRSCIEERYL